MAFFGDQSASPVPGDFPDVSAIQSDGLDASQIEKRDEQLNDLKQSLTPWVTVMVGHKAVKFPQLDFNQLEHEQAKPPKFPPVSAYHESQTSGMVSAPSFDNATNIHSALPQSRDVS